jgi:hypothetical protein
MAVHVEDLWQGVEVSNCQSFNKMIEQVPGRQLTADTISLWYISIKDDYYY